MQTAIYIVGAAMGLALVYLIGFIASLGWHAAKFWYYRNYEGGDR